MTAQAFEARWYWCDLTDAYELEEPDWSKVPADKNEQVRERWMVGAKAKLRPQRVQLWGPQIPFYLRQPKLDVLVIGP